MKIEQLSILTFLVLILLSCEPIPHNFSAEELKHIDSLYQIKKDSVELLMKAECDSIFLETFQGVVDSLSEIRKKEIYDIIEQ